MGSRSMMAASAAMALALSACGSNTNDAAAPEAMATDDVAAVDAMATDAGAPDATKATPEFVAAAASGGLYEVESSKLAKDKAKSADIKTFAAMMITDHGKANEELKAAAAKSSPPAPVPATLDAEHQALIDQLKNAGTNFDKTYLDQQATAHQKTLALLNGYTASGDSQPVKDWATKATPVVQKHADKLKELAGKM